jgi:hypothetical protein
MADDLTSPGAATRARAALELEMLAALLPIFEAFFDGVREDAMAALDAPVLLAAGRKRKRASLTDPFTIGSVERRWQATTGAAYNRWAEKFLPPEGALSAEEIAYLKGMRQRLQNNTLLPEVYSTAREVLAYGRNANWSRDQFQHSLIRTIGFAASQPLVGDLAPLVNIIGKAKDWYQRVVQMVRTETTAIHNVRKLAYHVRNAGSYKKWVAHHDDRTRATHLRADGQTVRVDQDFIVGGYALGYPGDPRGPAKETANCRCVLVGARGKPLDHVKTALEIANQARTTDVSIQQGIDAIKDLLPQRRPKPFLVVDASTAGELAQASVMHPPGPLELPSGARPAGSIRPGPLGMAEHELRRVSDEDLERALADGLSRDPDFSGVDRVIAEMDRRQGMEQLAEQRRRLRREATAIKRAQANEAQWVEVQRRIDNGEDPRDAVAYVTGLSVMRQVRSELKTRLVAEGMNRANTLEQMLRAKFRDEIARRYVSAEWATRGQMLNSAAKAAGIDPFSLFSGQEARARKWASDELKRWWSEHGRITYDTYSNQLLNYTRTQGRTLDDFLG